MRFLQLLVLAIFLGLIGLFCLQNLLVVPMQFLNFGASVPLPVLVLVVYVLGMLSGWSVVAYLRRSFDRLTDTDPNANRLL